MQISIAKTKACELIDKHIPGWSFKFSRAKRQFGKCIPSKKIILLSAPLTELNNDKEVIGTILHEIAHAMTPGKHHGRFWKHQAVALGCRPGRCYDSKIIIQSVRKFIGTCPKCDKKIFRHARKDISCGTCCKQYNYGKFSVDYKFRWSNNLE